MSKCKGVVGKPVIGILALQGNFAQHAGALDALCVPWRYVRKPSELADLQGLIIPGGESTALLKLMRPLNWLCAIRDFHANGGAIFGTCAGVILLAKRVSPHQESVGLLDIKVSRNAYGRQIDSFVAQGTLSFSQQTPMPFVFIRAPKILSVDSSVKVLAIHNGEPVMVAQGNVLASTFHPEMSSDHRVHEYFVHCMLAPKAVDCE
jgi:pyridoxal 5'-phosphate synthase pdxT subunit